MIYIGLELRYFKFGIDVNPVWFTKKLEDKTVELMFQNGKVIGCRYYDLSGRERIIHVGDIISKGFLYKEVDNH